MKTLHDSKRYLRFTSQRDKALEELHHKLQFKTTDILQGALSRALEIISGKWHRIPAGFYFTSQAVQSLSQIDTSITQEFRHAADLVTIEIMRFRKYWFLLSSAGEAEALAQATNKPKKIRIESKDLDDIAMAKLPEGESLADRVQLAFSRIRRDIMDALELSRVLEEDLDGTLMRVYKTFPGRRRVSVPRHILKRQTAKESFKEAKPPIDNPTTLTAGFITPEEWEEMRQEYLTDYIPKWRGPESVLDVGVEPGYTEEWYAWEVEQQITHDFVTQVRAGEVGAANQNGITDFLWIAIIDDKTDECVWRDGLTTQEIEEKLKGEKKDDDCDGSIPPIHFNCRCRLAPVGTEELEQAPPDQGREFEQWLND